MGEEDGGEALAMLSTLRFPRPSPVEWAYMAGGLVLCRIYFWLLDDCFVYFRYADNLLFLRIGLVYNAGNTSRASAARCGWCCSS